MKPALLLAALLSLAACSQQGEPDIQLGNAWARPTRGDAPGAVYVAINNKGSADDRLVGAFSDHSAMAMVHQSELVDGVARMRMAGEINIPRSEEHTSELQSRLHLVCRLLLEKKK